MWSGLVWSRLPHAGAGLRNGAEAATNAHNEEEPGPHAECWSDHKPDCNPSLFSRLPADQGQLPSTPEGVGKAPEACLVTAKNPRRRITSAL